MNKKKKLIITLAVIVVLVGVIVLISLLPEDNYADKYADTDLDTDVIGIEREGTYAQYVESHAGVAKPSNSVQVDVSAFTSEGDVESNVNYEGVKAVEGKDGSTLTWTVNVPQEGFYNIEVDYYIPKSRGINAQRQIMINGEIPFEDATNVSFTRVWKDDGEPIEDNQGNIIRPSQIEEYMWQTRLLSDDRGYIAEPYKFFFNKGSNTISFYAESEPMAVSKLSLVPEKEAFTYADYVASYQGKPVGSQAATFSEKVQGEDSTLRSESSLYAKFDRSSPTTEPNSVTTTVLNYVGGEPWKDNGQWIEWEFTVPEDGLYTIMIKGRQNYSRGSVSSRKIYIDGEIPFDELNEVSFAYGNDWECKVLGSSEEEPYEFFLTAGTHKLRMEATLGQLGDILTELENSTLRLLQMYRRILVVTGATPDTARDYHIEKVYPDIYQAMDLESKRLYKLVDDMVAFRGQKDQNVASSQTLAKQLEKFVKKPQKITSEFTTFKDNITALGTAAITMAETKLDIDYIVINGVDKEFEKDRANVFTSVWHEIKSFVSSFFVDYNSVGDVSDDDDVLKVWVTTGRDQGTILKAMIDDTFTPQSGIPVNVEIVQAGVLLNAVMAGRGPDVALTVGTDQPVNYALRGSAVDVTQFSDWKEVFSNFTESSYEQYKLDDENGVTHIYGIPEQQTFNVMFYRKDVLEELGLEVPDTWNDLIEMLPTIQGNNLQVGIPTPMNVVGGYADLSMYFTLLFQNGGDMYNQAGTRTTVQTEEGIKAFDEYIRYFNDYGLPSAYDFVSRFRSGEMPIGIQPYSTFNTLQVSAPEIRGLWDFTVIPGTKRTDENGKEYVDRTCYMSGSATMMINSAKNKDIQPKAWEFVKWWVGTDTQVRFGREIEALLGSSARYNTANREAFKQLSWSANDIKTIDDQWQTTRGIREVPGGYMTGRHITNAARKVMNEKDDPRETIIDYSILIDNEIDKKRLEFGLPIAD